MAVALKLLFGDGITPSMARLAGGGDGVDERGGAFLTAMALLLLRVWVDDSGWADLLRGLR